MGWERGISLASGKIRWRLLSRGGRSVNDSTVRTRCGTPSGEGAGRDPVSGWAGAMTGAGVGRVRKFPGYLRSGGVAAGSGGHGAACFQPPL